MKKILALALLCSMISSCSLLERRMDEEEPEQSKEKLALENEVARLNSKIEALETKLEVLTNNLEKEQVRQSQPAIQARANSPAPIEEMANAASTPAPKPIVLEEKAMSASPAAVPASTKLSAAEKEFQQSMEYFQNGRNLEAASGFTIFAQKHSEHPLAGHALYWAGEANARNKQWTLAIESWSELEGSYKHSAYIADALAGLAKAYEAQGNASKARSYRQAVQKSFPASPVALSNLTSEGPQAAAPVSETAIENQNSESEEE